MLKILKFKNDKKLITDCGQCFIAYSSSLLLNISTPLTINKKQVYLHTANTELREKITRNPLILEIIFIEICAHFRTIYY
jgi:hypothetical protein